MGYVCTNDSGVVVATGPDTVRGPDIAFYSDVQSPDDIQWSYATQPPQLVVEVLSPNDKPGVLSKRIDQYLNCGVPLIWVIDPDIRIVTVYPRGAQQKVFEEADELTGNSVLPDFRCQVRELFSLPGR
jgi:Uma2 family endonuclease